MRVITAALALAAITGAASAQYKTPPQGTPAVPVTANPNIQITPAPTNPMDELTTARRIPREEAMKMVEEKKAIYVDVRGKDQYDIEHIKGAISIPLGELANRMSELPKNKFIITYCA